MTGWNIARKLSCDFGLVVPRKLRAPNNEELAIGAIMGDGTTYLNEPLIKHLEISSQDIEKEKLDQLEEIKRREHLFLSNKTLTWKQLDLSRKTVILADDGVASGATIIAAVRSIKANWNPRRFMIAIPVVPNSTLHLLKREEIYHIVVITNIPDHKFRFVEQYYRDFTQLTDDQVLQIIQHNTRI